MQDFPLSNDIWSFLIFYQAAVSDHFPGVWLTRIWSACLESQALEESKENYRELLVRGQFLCLLNWVQQLQSEFKRRLNKTTRSAVTDFARKQEHWAGGGGSGGKQHDVMPAGAHLCWPPHPQACRVSSALMPGYGSFGSLLHSRNLFWCWFILTKHVLCTGLCAKTFICIFSPKNFHITPILQMRNQG